ncbi:MAG: Uma2 family endonuclease [Acidobacteria bacterium]|nr:Uma2 family endonuclease [Acidobacteriota bacterium]MCW5969933.1 Uma2 family endonuclease [Blastocatellales bacterium]
MGLPQPKPEASMRATVEEYLAMERAAEERHEYIDGEVYEMAGESGVHADICTNLLGILYTQLRGKPCRARAKDTKIRSGPRPQPMQTTKGMFSYPDIAVICGDPEYLDDYRDVVLNPTLIIGVLSPSTEAFDRGDKFHRYRMWLPTLQEYLLIAQHRPMVDHYRRADQGNWLLQPVEGLEAELHLASIDCRISMADIYDRIVFLPADETGMQAGSALQE